MFEPQIPNFLMMQAIDKARRNEWLQAAERDQQSRMAQRAASGRLDRVLAGLGDLLISAGEKLRARREPAMPRRSEAYRSGC